MYVGERGGKFSDIAVNHPAIDEVHAIYAGKFRRYHGESWLSRLLDYRTFIFNARDALFVMFGLVQARRVLKKIKPDVVFLKGGFVGVPVGIAAHWARIPFITHDSDSIPGLANRFVGRWARKHATALAAENYPQYPAESVEHVGVLVEDSYRLVNPALQKQYKKTLGLPDESLMLLITGGSSGAQRINQAMQVVSPLLLESYPALNIVHQVGKGNQDAYGAYHHERLHVVEFMHPMYQFTGAADVVVARAGANALAELGVQGKACIVVPSRFLTGGHQLKNAAYLDAQKAIVALDEASVEKNPEIVATAIRSLLDNPNERRQLASTLHAITIPDAAVKVAQLLLNYSGSK